ncbi:DUF1801 domain-containing protein [Flavobacterium sp. ANB]|jgi:hypothetical protein|uniref:DUF1801 domain-containing protein n=1 Tax=unclassified Flavobacterium TaxID=196869 RepID=UPI0012BA34B6|nr:MULTISPECIES: DUF1801 domain-containing protein [unclassified Flavobacterium]MBF4516187.1 DUF1801 domain-containing protein [Flavobacterium sp. ANB]MTD69916.1 hypothetical protein [Flavobacterium sp. LC2016-13]
MEKQSDTELVTALVEKLDAENKSTVAFLRQLILDTDKEIGEQVKWNSPSFYFTGEMKAFNPKEYKRDILVINIHRGSILLVFPTGSTITDIDILKAVNYPDGRKIIKIANLEEAKIKQKALQAIIVEWLGKVEK